MEEEGEFGLENLSTRELLSCNFGYDLINGFRVVVEGRSFKENGNRSEDKGSVEEP